jgi:AcrR family transcriptional regulator
MSTSSRKRHAYHHGDLRAVTLRAARELLEKQGADAVVLREVARRAGVSHNAPYRHFESREALLAALAADGFAEFAQRMASAGAGGQALGEAYVGFALEHPQLFRLMFGGAVKLRSDPELARASRRAYDGLVDTFRSRGDVADPETAAAAAWSLVHGLAHLLLAGHFPQATAEGTQTAEFVRRVTAAVRFATAAQRPA